MVRGGVLIAVLAAVTGCRDDLCDSAVSYCTDGILHHCVNGHPEGPGDSWAEFDCVPFAGYCVEVEGGAMCAADAEPRAACDGVPPNTRVCDGDDHIVGCKQGYAMGIIECGPGLCADSLEKCAIRPGPQAKCMGRIPQTEPTPLGASYCEGDLRITCQGDYAIREDACDPGRCIETMHVAGCKLAVDPDPSCTQPSAPYEYGVCVGNTLIKCLGTYRVSSFTCGNGMTCSAGACRS